MILVLLLGLLTPAQASEDLQLLRLALTELHGGVDRYAARDEVEKSLRGIERGLPRSGLESNELYRRLSALAPLIRDGHTVLDPQREPRRLLPLELRIVNGQLFDLSSGREIVSIDSGPAREWIRRASAMQWRDGDVATRPAWLLNRGHELARAIALLSDEPATYRVRFAGEAQDVLLQARAPSKPAPLQAARDVRLRMHGKVAVLTIPTFEPDLTSRFRQLFEQISQVTPAALIIDIRGNGGGLDSNGAALFSHLTDRPFRYYRGIFVNTLDPPARIASLAAPLRGWRIERDSSGRLQFTGHSTLGIRQPAQPRYTGPLIVLIDGGTFSSAAEFAAMVRHHKRAAFLGEESGGAYGGNTSGATATLTLPHSGITVMIPMMRYEMAVSGHPAGRGVMPDIAVTPSIQDLRAGRDPVLERALAEANRSQR